MRSPEQHRHLCPRLCHAIALGIENTHRTLLATKSEFETLKADTEHPDASLFFGCVRCVLSCPSLQVHQYTPNPLPNPIGVCVPVYKLSWEIGLDTQLRCSDAEMRGLIYTDFLDMWCRHGDTWLRPGRISLELALAADSLLTRSFSIRMLKSCVGVSRPRVPSLLPTEEPVFRCGLFFCPWF